MWELNKHMEKIILIYKAELLLKNKLYLVKAG
jgi:hypothetical protein